jgi:hypothetical protein
MVILLIGLVLIILLTCLVLRVSELSAAVEVHEMFYTRLMKSVTLDGTAQPSVHAR